MWYIPALYLGFIVRILVYPELQSENILLLYLIYIECTRRNCDTLLRSIHGHGTGLRDNLLRLFECVLCRKVVAVEGNELCSVTALHALQVEGHVLCLVTGVDHLDDYLVRVLIEDS